MSLFGFFKSNSSEVVSYEPDFSEIERYFGRDWKVQEEKYMHEYHDAYNKIYHLYKNEIRDHGMSGYRKVFLNWSLRVKSSSKDFLDCSNSVNLRGACFSLADTHAALIVGLQFISGFNEATCNFVNRKTSEMESNVRSARGKIPFAMNKFYKRNGRLGSLDSKGRLLKKIENSLR